MDPENDPAWYKAHSATYPCYKITEQALFNFQALRNLDTDWKAKDPKTGETVSFNLCHYADTAECGSDEKDDGDAFAYMTKDGGKCAMLTSDTPQAEVATIVTKTVGEDEVEGVRIMRAGGSACPADDSKALSFTLDVWCSPDS